MPDTQTGRDVVALIQRGDVSGSSFAFKCISDRWVEEGTGKPLRILEQVDLFELGPVAVPAYPSTDTDVTARCFPDGLPPSVRRAVGATAAPSSNSNRPLTRDERETLRRRARARIIETEMLRMRPRSYRAKPR